jgi:purine-binding chemotaxis protein CheW
LNGATRRGSLSAEELRRAFDANFAAPPARRIEDIEQLLALRIGGTAYALPVLDIAGYSAARPIVAIPSPIPELLGLAGVRGTLLPVYSLEALLGRPVGSEPPRWFVQCKGADPVALGFSVFEGHLDLPRSGIRATTGGEDAARHVRRLLRAGDEVRAVIDVASVLKAIRERVAALESSKEP